MQVNHFDCEEVRHLILPSQFESIFARVVTQTMGSKEVGPEIKVSRFGTKYSHQLFTCDILVCVYIVHNYMTVSLKQVVCCYKSDY